jgi:hypothetical protein
MPSVELVELKSLIYRTDPQPIGLPADPRSTVFPCVARLFDRSSPASCEVGSFPQVQLPLRSSLVVPPGCLFRGRLHCLGFVPLRDTTGAVHSCENTPALATFRSQAFSASQRLAPNPVLRACCIPQSRPGFRPFRGFSRLAASLAHRQLVPPSRWFPSAHRRHRAASCHLGLPRVRGVTPQIEAFDEFGV